MFERNDGKGINAIQNKFTSMLKTALHNHRIDYAIKCNRITSREIPLTDYTGIIGEEYDFMQAMIDYEAVKDSLKILTERERKIIILHILEDKDFAEIGNQLGLSYKGTATAFYKALKKLREALGRYRDEL